MSVIDYSANHLYQDHLCLAPKLPPIGSDPPRYLLSWLTPQQPCCVRCLLEDPPVLVRMEMAVVL